ncbi:C40 family peptidase [Burkholderia stagnalis]|uniref:C40 family peptidase n=1 Tax=Burkholderia stagnalis TaxID=1503054 RepID=UPI001F499C6D|nr:NlpC/P60 family protein [Burkholderia stagnalis]
MVTRADFVAEARTWMHTPFKAQGRIKGVGVDCGGLVVCVAKHFELTQFDVTGYRLRMGPALVAYCEEHMQRIPIEWAEPGDVLLFAWNGKPSHIAILTERDYIIHAYAPNREVVEHRLDGIMRSLIFRAYRVPGVI